VFAAAALTIGSISQVSLAQRFSAGLTKAKADTKGEGRGADEDKFKSMLADMGIANPVTKRRSKLETNIKSNARCTLQLFIAKAIVCSLPALGRHFTRS
jgi:hypothetical protein